VILEVGGKCFWEEINPWLKRFAAMLPFEAIAVNAQILDSLNKEEARLHEENVNPVIFIFTVNLLIPNNQSHKTFYTLREIYIIFG
jgi:large subunit ribosomal protein L16